jgi:hypothetical protein
MVFPTSELLLAGKPDMNKPFRIPKNPIHDLNLTGSNTIAKHKKKNKKWKVLSNNPVPIINNINGNPNNAAIISAAPPHFNSNPMARPMMMMMMPPRMSWMGHHSIGMNNGSVQNSIGPLNGGNNGHSNASEMPIPRNNIDNMMLSSTPSASTSSLRKKSVKRRKIASRNSNNKRAYYYPNMSSSFHAPLAPRNTTSFIMRAKQQGGIASAVTPSPATLVQTPLLSPGFREKGSLEEMNKELGVDGYGSMNGLIRLRSSYEDRAAAAHSETESDVEQGDNMTAIAVDGKGRSNGRDGEDPTVHSVEQRIDQGLSRFEMIYPSSSSTPPIQDAGGMMMMMRMMPRRDSSGSDNNIQNCVNGQERLIARLEEENLTLKERLFLVEQERNELRRRVREMEGLTHADDEVLLGEEHLEESCGDISTPCHQ